MDIALKVTAVCILAASVEVFQSLFWWILLWKREVHWTIGWTCFRFNPYSDGYCSERSYSAKIYFYYHMFQSLFWWILLWKSVKRDCQIWEDFCFNPYSDGYCSERRNARNSHSGDVRVSILILMDIALKVTSIDRLIICPILFQSLFWWILLWKTPAPRLKQNGSIVSILILMDIALKD